MKDRDKQKLVKAGFTLLRIDEERKVIKEYVENSAYKFYMSFGTKNAMYEEMRHLGKLPNIIEV